MTVDGDYIPFEHIVGRDRCGSRLEADPKPVEGFHNTQNMHVEGLSVHVEDLSTHSHAC